MRPVIFLLATLAWGQPAPPLKATREIARALAAICPGGVVAKAADGGLTGCRTCPSGSDFQGEERLSWELKQATFGHFTRSTAHDLVLSGSGCEPHTANFGGSFLMSLEAEHVRLVRYHKGLITARCEKFRLRDDRDFLVCRDEEGGQGVLSSLLYQVVFDSAGNGKAETIFQTEDSLATCGIDLEGNDFPVRRSAIQAIAYPDLDADGIPDLRIMATLGEKRLTKSEKERCKAGAGFDIPAQKFRIEFRFDGFFYSVTPASQAAYARFR